MNKYLKLHVDISDKSRFSLLSVIDPNAKEAFSPIISVCVNFLVKIGQKVSSRIFERIENKH